MPKQVLRVNVPQEINYFDLISNEITIFLDSDLVKPRRLKAGVFSYRGEKILAVVKIFPADDTYLILKIELPLAEVIQSDTEIFLPISGSLIRKLVKITPAGKRYLLLWLGQQIEMQEKKKFYKFLF